MADKKPSRIPIRIGYLFPLIVVLLFGCQENSTNRFVEDQLVVDSLNIVGTKILRTDRDSAIKLANLSIQKSKEIGYLEGEANALSIIGICKTLEGEFDSSVMFHRFALDLRRKTDNKVDDAKSLSNIGEVYQNFNDLRYAIKLFDSAFVIYRENDSLHYLSGILGNKAISYAKMGVFDTARILFRESLNWANSTDVTPRALLSANKNYSLVLEDLGLIDSSIYFLAKAFDIAIEQRLDGELPGLYQSMVVLQMDDLEAAKRWSNRAIVLADSLDLPALKKNIYSGRLVMAGKENDWINQKESYDSLLAITDRVNNRGRLKDFAEFEVKYNLAEKEAQNRMLKAESEHKSRRQKWLIALLLGALLLIVFVVRNLRLTKKVAARDKELAEQKVNQIIQNQEVQRIDHMIEAEEKERKRIATELHDRVGSLLGALKLNYDAIEDQHSEVLETSGEAHHAVKSILQESIVEVRRISHNMAGGLIEQFGLIQALEKLIATINSSGKIKIDFYKSDLDGALTSHQEITVFRIVQELIGNVLKHANANSIEVSLNRSDDQLIIMVEDDGVGFDVVSASKGIGLQNIKNRIESIGGEIHIDSHVKSGTSVTLEIPVL